MRIAAGTQRPVACGGTGKAASRLSLAAAPTFALMAVATGLLGGDPAAMICSGTAASPLTGMAFMYGLMAVFHLPPWARLMRAA